MKLIRCYYAYLAIAGGLLIGLALQDNWMLQIVGYALISAGALSLQQVSRWFLRASIAADVCIGLKWSVGRQCCRRDSFARCSNMRRLCRCC